LLCKSENAAFVIIVVVFVGLDIDDVKLQISSEFCKWL